MRTIDADVFINELNQKIVKTECLFESIYFTRFRDMVTEQPTIDAVEVVRCKDCVHFMEYTPEHTAKVEHADGDCRIRLMRSDDPQFNCVLKNEFCSFGRVVGGKR